MYLSHQGSDLMLSGSQYRLVGGGMGVDDKSMRDDDSVPEPPRK